MVQLENNITTMKDFVKRMITEHKELVERIQALNDYVYKDISEADDRVEFANKCVQLVAMRNYEAALCDRLKNQGIVVDCGEYFEKVNTDKLTDKLIRVPVTCKGNDLDLDKKIDCDGSQHETGK